MAARLLFRMQVGKAENKVAASGYDAFLGG
jgi:hypothetical protein